MTGRADQDNTARTQKSVHLIPADAAIKRLCFDDSTQSLRPNLVLVDRTGAVVFEINELGLKGAARDPARKLAVVWGDSVVFGVRRSWPCLLDALAPGYQFLNGGIEGDPYRNILRRAATFNETHEVALNILMPGWHAIPPPPAEAASRFGRRIAAVLRRRDLSPPPAASGNTQLLADLIEFLQRIPNTVLLTMPTALHRRIADRDLSSLFTRDRDVAFYFAGDHRYSVAAQRHLFDHITERNAIVRTAATESGALLVDLAAVFDTETLADFREDFFDVLHLRPRAYPKAAAAVHAAIKAWL